MEIGHLKFGILKIIIHFLVKILSQNKKIKSIIVGSQLEEKFI